MGRFNLSDLTSYFSKTSIVITAILLLVVLAISLPLTIGIFHIFGNGPLGIAVTFIACAILIIFAIKVGDVLGVAITGEKPQDLKIGGIELDFKAVWKSKIFWLAVLGMVASIINTATGIDLLDQEFIDQVSNLDWSKLIPAITSLVIILVRKFFIGNPIK